MSTRQLRPRSTTSTPLSKAASASSAAQLATPVSPAPAGLSAARGKRAAPASATAAGTHKKLKVEEAGAPPSPPETPLAAKGKAGGKVGAVGAADENKPVVKQEAGVGTKRRRGRAGANVESQTAIEADALMEELLNEDGKPEVGPRAGRKRAKAAALKVDDDASATAPPKPAKHPKAHLLASLDRSPFPNFKNPPTQKYYDVVNLLATAHGYSSLPSRPKELFDLPGAGAGCGQVPFVLDGLCRTIISQSVTSASAKRVKDALDDEYGRGEYRRMLEGGEDKLMEVVGVGGLRKKGSWIFQILKWVDERQGGQGVLSLEWLREKSDQEILEVFLGFQGVGLKTAYCMLLLNIGRDRMAVDTHVWRLAKQLGWCPQNATADQCAIHLDNTIPDELKYALHILLWREGKGCKRCAVGGKTSLELAHTATGICPMEKYCKREKGTPPAPKAAKVEVVGEGKVVAKEEDVPAEAEAEMEEEKPRVDGAAYVEH